jgi:HEAT repeat protein
MKANSMKMRALNPLLLAGLLALVSLTICADEEQDLIATLQSDAGPVQKAEACRRLRIVGTAKAVPALAALLGQERVSQAARYALEGLPLPEAVAALRQALGKTSGPIKAGLIDSLGWRGDVEAVPLLKPLLLEADAMIAASAATALGRIGGQEAQAALDSARAKVPPMVRPAVQEGLIRCAERLLAEGNRAAARAIYQSLVAPAEAEHIRVAAYGGLLRCADGPALPLVTAAIQGADAAGQLAALQLAGRLPDPNATKALAALLPNSSPALQLALLGVLQQRNDPKALPAIATAARSPESAVRAAAASALGPLGDATVVQLLAEAATSQDAAEQAAARQALITLHRGEVTAALVNGLNSATPAVQAELVRALSARGEKSVVPELLELARSDRTAARKAAHQALGNLADGSHLKSLVRLLAEAKDEAARDAARNVFEALAERAGETGSIDVEPILRGLSDGDVETRKELLQVSALFADDRLQAALRAGLKDADQRIRSAAARALCAARDARLLPDLLDVARQSPEANLRALALEASVRLATDESSSLSTPQRVGALAAAFAAAPRPADKRLVLSGLARVPDQVTLNLAEVACADASVKAEAEFACLQIARGLGASDFEAVRAPLTRLAAQASNLSVQTNAQALLKYLDSGWLCSGPYRQPGKECQELFDIAFAPEQAQPGEIKWQRAPGSPDLSRPGEVDLGSIVRGDHCVVYLKTQVYVPAAQTVRLLIGTDDGIKLWVNGELVHANNAVRGLTPDQDRAKASLRQGWNELRAKITQHTAGCGLILRFRTEAGAEVSGLRLDARGGTP